MCQVQSNVWHGSLSLNMQCRLALLRHIRWICRPASNLYPVNIPIPSALSYGRLHSRKFTESNPIIFNQKWLFSTRSWHSVYVQSFFGNMEMFIYTRSGLRFPWTQKEDHWNLSSQHFLPHPPQRLNDSSFQYSMHKNKDSFGVVP